MLDNLVLPDDENVGVAIHMYNPGDFTHQGFEWAGRERGVQIRLTESLLSALKWDIEQTAKFIKNTGRKVHINEFGLNIELADTEDRSTYLRTITQFCKDYDITWTMWGYNNQDTSFFYNGKWKNGVLDDLFLR